MAFDNILFCLSIYFHCFMYKRHFTEKRVSSKMFQILLVWPLPLSIPYRSNVVKKLENLLSMLPSQKTLITVCVLKHSFFHTYYISKDVFLKKSSLFSFCLKLKHFFMFTHQKMNPKTFSSSIVGFGVFSTLSS